MKANTILIKLLAGLFFLTAFAVFEDAHAQRIISGTVSSDDDGEPLAGVNVVIQGTQIGVVTDALGEYEIRIEDDSQVLVYSMVGFETYETTVGTRNMINVTLQLAEAEL